MSDHVDSVKEYIRLMEGWRKTASQKGDFQQVVNYDRRLRFLQQTVDELEELRRLLTPVPASYGDLSDLPPALVKELTGIKVDDLEQQVFTIIKAAGKEADLDVILIELFRRFKVLQTRKFLQNKLWRMAQKEIIFSVPARKGVYTATKPVDFEALLGSEDDANIPAPVSHGGSHDDLDDDSIPF